MPEYRLIGGPWDEEILYLPAPGTTAVFTVNGFTGRYDRESGCQQPLLSAMGNYDDENDIDDPLENSYWFESGLAKDLNKW